MQRSVRPAGTSTHLSRPPPLSLQSGGLLIDFARQPATGHVSSLVFSRWISLCYMAQAQLGSAFPGALCVPMHARV